MKTIYSLILLTLLTVAQNTQAQVWMGIYGVRSNTINSLNPDVGGGFAMNFLSKGSKLGAEKSTLPFQVQYGGNFFWSGLGHRTFSNVPLLAPQIGTARVNLSNSFFGFNVMGRISMPNKTIFTPYADVFGGYRGIFSTLEISPYYNYYYGNRGNQTNKTLSSVSGLGYGFGGGIMTTLSKRVKLDIGVSYSQALGTGQYADLSSAYSDASGINLNMKSAPNGIVMVNFGLMFYLEDDGTHSTSCHCNTRTYGRVGGWGGGWGGGGGGRSNVGVHVGGGFGGGRVR
ncbi:MAG TPA: hypothetical protein VNZ49_16875 [Bacteroidia bacterium]|jgi:hypothetical protein|nr:hypothetical protein [Bacteroidia bacterium]